MEKLLRWFNFTLKMIAPRMIREDTRPRSGRVCCASVSFYSSRSIRRPIARNKKIQTNKNGRTPFKDAAS
jgi:hypothetical protein